MAYVQYKDHLFGRLKSDQRKCTRTKLLGYCKVKFFFVYYLFTEIDNPFCSLNFKTLQGYNKAIKAIHLFETKNIVFVSKIYLANLYDNK